MKYIHFDPRRGRFYLHKRINNKNYYFGTYSSLTDAKKARSYFEEKGWGNCIHERLRFTSPKSNNIVWLKSAKRYQIRKMNNGKLTIYGSFRTFEEAEKEVELLRQVGWDMQALCDLSTDDSPTSCPRCNRSFA